MDSIYGTMQSYIYIHHADKAIGTCNAYCRTGLPCAQGAAYFGTPYDVRWTTPTLSRFRTIGNKNLTCNIVIKHITTSYGGWKVKKASNVHTAGCINLDCDSLNIRIAGSDVNGSCLPPVGWDLLPIHGNANVDSVYNFSGGGGEGKGASSNSYWWWSLLILPAGYMAYRRFKTTSQ